MGYLHIKNLYADQDILLFKECFALEKIHGTSAHVAWDKDAGAVKFFSGGANYEQFTALFDKEALHAKFADLLDTKTVFFGEAYGGKMQGMRKTYGPDLKFVVFDVKVGDCWLSVPQAHSLACQIGFDFVDFCQVPTTLEALDAERDKDSVQAVRNNMGDGHLREGVVLRPLIELRKNNGERIITKHKRPEFRETKTIPEIDPSKRELLVKAQEIAEEFVTPMRLSHVLDKLGNPTNIEATGKVISAMQEDVVREAEGFIVDSSEARKAISARTAKLYKAIAMRIDPDKQTHCQG